MRYFGGKWLLADWIISHFPPHKIYVEPFGGSASVFLRKPPAKVEVYNDLDDEIVNVFAVVRDPQKWPELQRRMRFMPYARAEFQRRFDEPADDIERALQTLVKSRMGFGANAIWDRSTSFRTRRDERSTPAHEWAALWPDVKLWAERFAGVTVECSPAIAVIQRYDNAEALHYVDPPYVHASRGKRNRYKHEMTDEQHRELAAALREAKGFVILSGYDCELYREMFADWQRLDRPHLADGALERTESLWLSPATAAALHPRLL